MSAGITPAVQINGAPVDCLSSLDRGLLYGDGVFETISVRDGEPRFWFLHMARLTEDCQRLGIPSPDQKHLLAEVSSLLPGRERCVLKIIVSRGCGGRGYRAPAKAAPTQIIQVHSWPDYPQTCNASGVRVRLCSLRLGHNPALAGIKHLNRLEQVQARREWDDPDIMEGLLRDDDGNLIEGTMSNLFLVRSGVLMTPDLARCGVAGVMRSVVMDLAETMSLQVDTRELGLSELAQADEVFVTNSVIGIWPVVMVDETAYHVGPVTLRLQELVANLDSATGTWHK